MRAKPITSHDRKSIGCESLVKLFLVTRALSCVLPDRVYRDRRYAVIPLGEMICAKGIASSFARSTCDFCCGDTGDQTTA